MAAAKPTPDESEGNRLRDEYKRATERYTWAVNELTRQRATAHLLSQRQRRPPCPHLHRRSSAEQPVSMSDVERHWPRICAIEELAVRPVLTLRALDCPSHDDPLDNNA